MGSRVSQSHRRARQKRQRILMRHPCPRYCYRRAPYLGAGYTPLSYPQDLGSGRHHLSRGKNLRADADFRHNACHLFFRRLASVNPVTAPLPPDIPPPSHRIAPYGGMPLAQIDAASSGLFYFRSVHAKPQSNRQGLPRPKRRHGFSLQLEPLLAHQYQYFRSPWHRYNLAEQSLQQRDIG